MIERHPERVAHDFNNLLTVILGYCDLLLLDLDPADPRYSDVIEIQNAGTRAAGLARQWLAFLRKEISEPAVRDPPVADTTSAAVADPPAAGATPGRAQGETVLVLDDAAGLRALAKRFLERLGYTVMLAGSAEEALRLVERNTSIDVLLTDVVMPGTSGPELTRQLLGQRPALKIIYMSGYTAEGIAHHGILTPGTAFLQKPFSAGALGRTVRDVLDRAS